MGRCWFALCLIAAALVAGCDGDDDDGGTCVYQGQTYPIGASFPAGDGCNTCGCDEEGVSCTLIDCNDVDAGVSCAPSGSCAVGPTCSGICCDTGEACIDGECRCGDQPGCQPGDTCEAAGPIGGDSCGSICCGVTGPCPQ